VSKSVTSSEWVKLPQYFGHGTATSCSFRAKTIHQNTVTIYRSFFNIFDMSRFARVHKVDGSDRIITNFPSSRGFDVTQNIIEKIRGSPVALYFFWRGGIGSCICIIGSFQVDFFRCSSWVV
jgi:hypothetical protein